MTDRIHMASRGGRASREPSGPWTIQALVRCAGSCRGFSLVEIILAMMVVAVAILAIFSMFPSALNQGSRAAGDTYASLFAEQVFNALHAQAETNWASIGVAGAQPQKISVACESFWDNGPNLEIQVLTNGGLRTLIFENLQMGANQITVNHALRYRLTLTTNGNVKSAVLLVWDGEIGSLQDPNVFYAQFHAK